MKTRNLVVGLAVVVALAAAIPAVAAIQHGRQGRAGSTASHHSRDRRRPHARPARRDARSAVAIPSAPFTAESLTATARAELARDGSVVLPISFSGPGTVVASGEAAVGTATETAIGTAPDGQSEAIQVPSDYMPAIRPATVTATAAGTADLTIDLTAWAKSQLAAGHDVDVFLSLDPAQGPTASVPGLAMLVELPGS